MLGPIVLAYGLLTSFVLSGASRNHRLRRPHPPQLVYVGYVLCGLSAGFAALLLGSAMVGQAPTFLA